ncbi:gp436 family protein [Halopseudomonas phragmitis]|uniref:DUF1320 domain-containing protein n=1 Tax=Halopseudomonas phragmitis TaxID=1931241 RepID=A0A1V0B6N7_9GAMM|nr:DUF1320 domain-containing protein [Halopseudomonas phragmitis]AQZ95560.1 hypothetical protein BVH74_12725 [Halopseudomonas phragmitis]
MPYLTLTELADRPGAEELAQVATPRRYRAVDADLLDALLRSGDVSGWPVEDVQIAELAIAVIDDAMVTAQGTIDGFLVRRGYSLPLTKRYGIVTGWARAITRYHLHKDRLSAEQTDPIVRDYRDALKFLQLVAEGKFSLGPDDPLTPTTSGAPLFKAPPRTFSHDTLKDY